MKSRAAISSARPPKPSAADIADAAGKGIRDVVAPDLRVLFVGINPGLYTAATGHHFARPGNRFWPALHAAGFTPRLLHPSEQRLLLQSGYGITNLVNRATATAEEVAAHEFVAGRRRLAAKVRRLRPSYRLRDSRRKDGPKGKFDGTFVEDFEYVARLGDLDKCNGRMGPTPQFPNGIYYYAITDEFPYVPRLYRGKPDAAGVPAANRYTSSRKRDCMGCNSPLCV